MAATSNERLFRQAKKNLQIMWAGHEVKLGATLYQALLAQELLRLLAHQDPDISDARVRELLLEGYLWLRDETERNFS